MARASDALGDVVVIGAVLIGGVLFYRYVTNGGASSLSDKLSALLPPVPAGPAGSGNSGPAPAGPGLSTDPDAAPDQFFNNLDTVINWPFQALRTMLMGSGSTDQAPGADTAPAGDDSNDGASYGGYDYRDASGQSGDF